MQHKKRFETYLYSAIGVIVMAVIVIAINIIVRPMTTRLDLTEDKAYTLSDGTKRVLAKLDTPVQIRFYFSAKDPATPVDYKTYAARVEDMLSEYKLLAKGNIEIKKLDPAPDTEAEDSANLDGVEGQMTSPLGGDRIYFGLAVSCLDARATIPFLSPQRERLLEYDLTRAISQVAKPQKPIIGVMSGLPVFGGFNPQMMRMGSGGRTEPWLFINELKADFDVKEVPMTAEKIDDEVKVLLVVYPKGITEAAEFAIDQFVMRGGKLIAFLDPLSVFDNRAADPSNPLQAAANSGASLDRLLKAWGPSFDISKVVADKTYFTEVGGPNGRQSNPTVLTLPPGGMDTNDVVTSQIERVCLPFVGAFAGSPAEGLKQVVLMHSSGNSDLTEKMLAQYGGASQDFKASGKEYPLAVRLSGKFKTAFPDGKPGEENPADGSTNAPPPTAGSLKASKDDNVVILIGDADMLHENAFAQIQNFFGQRVMIPIAQNLTFVQNLIEQLGGDSDLITIRSRAILPRPFTKVRELQAKAEERFAAKIKELEKSEQELSQKINELIQGKQPGQQVILSEEAKKDWQNVQEQRAKVRDDLRMERRNLRKDIDSLQTSLKWINILVMPLVVAGVGIALALVKRRKTAAR